MKPRQMIFRCTSYISRRVKAFLTFAATQAQLDRLSQRAVYLERLVNDAESRIRESETWKIQLEEEQTQILRLKTLMQPQELRSPAGNPTKTFIRKSSLAASKKMFESGEARLTATSPMSATNLDSAADSAGVTGNVRLGATLVHSSKSGEAAVSTNS
jgi:hypothetical protein